MGPRGLFPNTSAYFRKDIRVHIYPISGQWAHRGNACEELGLVRVHQSLIGSRVCHPVQGRNLRLRLRMARAMKKSFVD